MAIYCNTLEGNMQYSDDPYCFTPSMYTHIHTYAYIYIIMNTRLYKHKPVSSLIRSLTDR